MASRPRTETRLPVEEVLPELHERLARGGTVLLQAPPGAGKTTRVPLALLDAPWLQDRTILMLEPRRIAARSAAERMASMLGEPVGRTVGYRVRLERKVSDATRVEVLTEGLLTRRLQDDPQLEGVGLVIFDEFHERNLQSDLALALCRDVASALREDLRMLLMSATLDTARLAPSLDAPVVSSEGRQFPVEVRHLPLPADGPMEQGAMAAIRKALAEVQGDILVFLPGAAEIGRLRRMLEDFASGTDLLPVTLYGELGLEEQRQAILPDPSGRRKVVLATNIAETSLTIEGVRVVVDSGYRRAPRFDPRSGLTRLETVRISRASAEQRRGRAGRLGPGVCYRLWGEGVQQGLVAHDSPEIESADLVPLALELASWGVASASELQWLTPPSERSLEAAWELLQQLEAVEGRRITAHGRAMAALPLHPRLAHMVLKAVTWDAGPLACDMAALLSERDILRGSGDAELGHRLEALRSCRHGGSASGADIRACRAVDRSAAQIRRVAGITGVKSRADDSLAGRLLALAYPERIGLAREGHGRFLLAAGRGARMAAEDPLAGAPCLVAAVIDDRGKEGRILLGTALAVEDIPLLFPEAGRWHQSVEWDGRQQAVSAVRQRRLGALVLEARPADIKRGDERVVGAMLRGIRETGLDGLGWDAAARSLQARVLCLRAWIGAEWPDVSDEALLQSMEQWLPPYLNGISRFQQLSRLSVAQVLSDRLGWERMRQLDELAPERITVPSGSRLRLLYRPGEPPLLKVKLQEMFGLGETPRVAGGRVAVLVELLSPAGRPVQVTQDLTSFWREGYVQVRKELKGRYPRHPWPDDPWLAPATRRTKSRKD